MWKCWSGNGGEDELKRSDVIHHHILASTVCNRTAEHAGLHRGLWSSPANHARQRHKDFTNHASGGFVHPASHFASLPSSSSENNLIFWFGWSCIYAVLRLQVKDLADEVNHWGRESYKGLSHLLFDTLQCGKMTRNGFSCAPASAALRHSHREWSDTRAWKVGVLPGWMISDDSRQTMGKEGMLAPAACTGSMSCWARKLDIDGPNDYWIC